MNLLKEINQEIEDFKNKEVTIVPGLTFNQWDILQRIFHYWNSRFTNPGGSFLDPVDDDGDRMYFYNIVKNPAKVFSKAIDFDTKNIRLVTAPGGDTLKTWFMERDLKFWMRDKNFGRILNRIFVDLPIYGTVVLKIIKGQPYFVDLRNFIVQQSADTLDDSSHIIEIHNFTEGKFRKVAKEMNWSKDKVEETVSLFREMKGISHIRVYERYGMVGDLQDSGETDYTYRRTFYADVGVDEYDEHGQMRAEHLGVELSSEEWEGHPYREIHADKIPGRWLGIGVVETLFEPQIRHNQLANLQSKASYWLSLHVFQTRDPAFNKNLSTEIRNGEVLNSESDISEVVVADRNLAHFGDEFNKWITNRDELTFSYDVVQGERLPAGTPLGSAQIAQAQTLSYFEQIQENIALDIKEILFKDIIPQFQKDNTSAHTLRLVGEDLEQYAQMVKNHLVAKQMVKLAVQSITGQPFPGEEERELAEVAIVEAIKQGKERLLEIPKDFYKDIKYDVDIDITGESIDTRVRQATIFAILQAITSDPSMTQDPTKKKILYWMAENGGINPMEIFDAEKEKTVQDVVDPQGRAGGGVSAPALGGAIPGQTSQMV